jgi:YD repeat-containing protein
LTQNQLASILFLKKSKALSNNDKVLVYIKNICYVIVADAGTANILRINIKFDINMRVYKKYFRFPVLTFLLLVASFIIFGCSKGSDDKKGEEKNSEIVTVEIPKQPINTEQTKVYYFPGGNYEYTNDPIVITPVFGSGETSGEEEEEPIFEEPVIRKLSEFNPSGELKLYELYQYEINGNLVKISDYSPTGSLRSYSNRTYDDKGYLIKEITSDLTVRTYEYDANGNLIKESFVYQPALSNHPTQVNGYYLYEYDANEILIKESTYISGSLDSDPSLSNYYIYEYDSNGILIKKIWYYATYDPPVYYIYEYDSAGNMIKELEYDNSDELTLYYTYEYNNYGNMIKYSKYIGENELQYYHTCEYDDDGNMTKVLRYDENAELTSYLIKEYY